MKISKITSCDSCLALSAKSDCILGIIWMNGIPPLLMTTCGIIYPLEDCPKPMTQDELNVAKKKMMK